MKIVPFVSSTEHQALTGKLRPSGRFSVCQVFRKKSKGFHNAKVQKPKDSEMRSVQYLDIVWKTILSGRVQDLSVLFNCDRPGGATIGLSIATNSPKRSNRGSKGITPRQRDVLCWSANVLERVYGKKCMSFLTLTLPPLSDRDFDSVRANWSDIVHRVVLRIKEKINAEGYHSAVVGCTELQLDRAKQTGKYYPHLHLVFRGRSSSNSDWAIKPHQFRQLWRRCVSKFLADRVDTWRASENVQQIRRSTGGYLAKYISKCASKSVEGVLNKWHPSDWVVVSRSLRGLYERLSCTGYSIGHTLLSLVSSWDPRLGYVKPIIVSTPAYGDRRIGYYGWLKGEFVCPTYSQLHPG